MLQKSCATISSAVILEMNDEQQQSDVPVEFVARLTLKPESVAWIERFRVEFGLNSRDATISRLLDELFLPENSD